MDCFLSYLFFIYTVGARIGFKKRNKKRMGIDPMRVIYNIFKICYSL